jgi:protoheme IX farnesyltransferase
LYTVWLIVASVLPAFGYTGQLFLSLPAATVVFVLGLWLLVFSVRLYKKQSSTAAKSLMIASIFYISLLQTIFILDKFLR